MENMQQTTIVNIRPEVNVLSIFPHLNYKPWFALAEFVDNSIQSYLANKSRLIRLHGESYVLRVSVEFSGIDGGNIVIRDNAAGIDSKNYLRAFKTAAVPYDKSGLSEFGVGMKSAACWFAQYWSVRTSAIDEDKERFIEFNVSAIVRDAIDEIASIEYPAKLTQHGTEVTLRSLHSIPQGRTLGKIKDHLASIYRVFIQEGVLELTFNQELLSYEPSPVLIARHYREESSQPILWRKDIDMDFGQGQRVFGFAALLEVASTSGAGFAIFRRKRLIQGSRDEGYRPEAIFRKSNSYTYQRLFGELHVEGFDVSHTKDGIQWAEHEDIFLELLKEELNTFPVPLLDQAEGYRARLNPVSLTHGAQAAIASTADAIERQAPIVVARQLALESSINTSPPSNLDAAAQAGVRTIEFEVRGVLWRITIELIIDTGVMEWLTLSMRPSSEQGREARSVRNLGIRISLVHPFMERYAGPDSQQIEPILRLGAALALAEVIASESGTQGAGFIRIHLNRLLREALSSA